MTRRQVSIDLLDTDETVIESGLRFIGGTSTFYDEQLDDAGAAQVQLPDAVDGVDDIDTDMLLRFKVDGTADFTARIEGPRKVVKALKPSDRVVTISARDWLAEFDDALIDPPLGVDSKPNATVVRFDWTHPELDRSSWTTPTFLGNLWTADRDPFGNAMGPPMTVKDGAAVEGWPDPFTGWIYSTSLDGNGSHDAGTSYFHTELSGLSAGPFLSIFTADDSGQLAFDGVLIDDGVQSPEVQWTKAWASGVDSISAGTHHLCVKVTNDGAYGTTNNPAAFALIAYQRSTSNYLEYGNIVARTADFVGGSDPLLGGNWVCLDNPTSAPGFTIGHAYRLMFEQAQDDNHLTGWTLGFTDTNDSNGNAWDVTEEITATVNDSHLDWFKQCHARGFAEFAARPGSRVLDAYRWGERGDYYTSPGSPPEWGDSSLQRVEAKRSRTGG